MNRLLALVLAATSPLVTLVAACAAEPIATPALAPPPLDPDHSLLGGVLARIVKPDGVDYVALLADHADLDAYRAQLARAPIPSAGPERMAHLINAYNAWTLALVIERLPTDKSLWPTWSIKEGGGALASVWKRYTFELGGQRLTLDQVEHAELRKLGDPRIHFAINCASRSCPALAAHPYRARTLDADLEAATSAFLRDPSQLRVAAGKLSLNPILDWFAADFDAQGGVRAFLLARLPEGPAKSLLSASRGLAFFDYDWRLNLAGAGR